MIRRGLFGACGGFFLLAAVAPSVAHADVRLEGDWSDDPDVTLDVDDVPRAEAVNRLAAAAGWSVVIRAPKGDRVSVHVKDQPASKVLDMVLSDGRYVARRDDTLVSVSPEAVGGAETPPPPPNDSTAPLGVPPIPSDPADPPIPAIPPPGAGRVGGHDDGRDRFVTGGNLRINADEVAHDVTVMGGNLDVFGTVTGDLEVMGGNVVIHRNAHVRGDAGVVGGVLTIESGAAVDGDAGVFGGELRREDGARVGGEIHEGVRPERRRHHHRERAARTAEAPAPPATSAAPARTPPGSWLRQHAQRAADALNGAALLFVFGAVLLALAPDRMDRLRAQIAGHPMRSFATGVVSLIAGIVLAAAVSITIIGIPIAVVGILGALIATLAGVCSVLETIGGALLSHRTRNPYVHLAVGALLVLVAGAIPYVGSLLRVAVLLTALGSVVATRAAGLFPAKSRFGAPYRQPAT